MKPFKQLLIQAEQETADASDPARFCRCAVPLVERYSDDPPEPPPSKPGCPTCGKPHRPGEPGRLTITRVVFNYPGTRAEAGR